MGTWLEAASCASSPLRWLKVTNMTSRHTVAGASQPRLMSRSRRAAAGREKRRALSPGEGRRGVQERNGVSQEFQSFIGLSFQTSPQFLQAVTVTASHGIRGKLQQLAQLVEGVLVPDFQNDHFALFARQFPQAAHGGPFLRCFAR